MTQHIITLIFSYGFDKSKIEHLNFLSGGVASLFSCHYDNTGFERCQYTCGIIIKRRVSCDPLTAYTSFSLYFLLGFIE